MHKTLNRYSERCVEGPGVIGHLEGTSVGTKIPEQEDSRTPPDDGTVVAVISFLLRELSLGAVAFILTLLPLPLGAVLMGCWSLSSCSNPCELSSSLLLSHNVQYFTHWSIIGYFNSWEGEKLHCAVAAVVIRVLCTVMYTIKDMKYKYLYIFKFIFF